MDYRICSQCGSLASGGEAKCLQCGGAVQYADASVFVGRSFGKFELVEVIGRGGMGVVLKGRHVTLGHPVAVKLLLPGLGDPTFGERFLREARLLAEVRHPNIVEVHDFDIAPGGVPYYVMEYLHGETLAAELARSPQGIGWQRTMMITRGVADALMAAHDHNVVHRDLKPENVFITRAGSLERVKLLDFGIARPLDETESSGSLTQTGHVIGTPRYFAPEQFYGYPVSAATDQYALALVVAEMLSGQPLRDAHSLGEVTLDGIGRVTEKLVTRLPAGTPPAAVDALSRALATDSTRRFASVADFAMALGAMPTQQAAVPAPTRRAAPAPIEAATRLSQAHSGKWHAGLRRRLGMFWQMASARVPLAMRNRRPLGLAALAAGVLLVAAIALALLRSPPADTSVAGNTAAVPAVPGSSAEPGALPQSASQPTQWLRAASSTNVPIDARGILLRVNDTVVLGAANGWYLQRVRGEGVTSRVDLPAGRRLLGPLDAGRLAVIEGDALLSIDPIEGSSQTLTKLPAEIEREARLWLAPDAHTLVAVAGGDLVVYRIEGETTRSVSRLPAEGTASSVALSRDWIAVATRGAARMHVYRTRDAVQVLDQPLDAGQVRDLRVLDLPARVAVATSGPEVHVFALDESAPRRSFSLQGGAQALAWIADYPTLLLAGDSGVALWREGALLEERYADIKLERGMTFIDGQGVLVLDVISHSLRQFDYGTLPIAAEHVIGKSEAWAVHVDAATQAVYVGSRDGAIHALVDGKVSHHPLHADGVTALVGDAGHLASASDDRTLAIWRLPDMTVQWRSRGHDFLVNQLQVQGDALWSSSSDGTLKRWHWPTLEAEETIDLRAITGRRLNLHAFQVDATATHALVGTWNSTVVALDRVPGKEWTSLQFPVESSGGYHALDLPGVGLQLVQGTAPARIYAYDPKLRTLYDLPDFGIDYYALIDDGSGSGAYAAGSGAIARYQLMRDPAGAPRWAASMAMRSDLRVIGAADLDAQHHRLWLADNEGRLLGVDTDAARLPPPVIGPAVARPPGR